MMNFVKRIVRIFKGIKSLTPRGPALFPLKAVDPELTYIQSSAEEKIREAMKRTNHEDENVGETRWDKLR